MEQRLNTYLQITVCIYVLLNSSIYLIFRFYKDKRIRSAWMMGGVFK